MKARKAERIGLVTIVVILMLNVVAQQVVAQQTDPIVALTPSKSNSQTELPQILREGSIEMRLEASPLPARVAEPIQIRLVVDAPEGSRVTMPMIGSALGQLEVVDQRLIKELPIDGEPSRRRWILLLTVEAIESGEFTVPSMEILYRSTEAPASPAAPRSIRSLPFDVEVISLLGENQDPKTFRDIKAAMEAPQEQSPANFTKWIVPGLAFSALALLGGFWWWRRDRTLAPSEWADQEISRIDSLLAAGSITRSDGYAELSDVLRQFLEEELGFPATAMSSAELREELMARSCPPATIARLTEFLAEADEVKFSGRSQPPVSRTDSPTSCLREIVQQVHQLTVAKVPLAQVQGE